MRLFASLALIFLTMTPALAAPRHKPVPSYKKGQQVPDKARTLQIQQALLDKGFTDRQPTGVWDKETIAVCKDIANKNLWQIDHVPDARVLILLGLGNQYSDPYVTTIHNDMLDRDQRKEYFRKHPGEAPQQ